jgi:hypothetical protein
MSPAETPSSCSTFSGVRLQKLAKGRLIDLVFSITEANMPVDKALIL